MKNKEEEEFGHPETADLRRRLGSSSANIIFSIVGITLICWFYYSFLNN